MAVPSSPRLGPIWIADDITRGNALTFLYAAFFSVCLLSFLSFMQPFVLDAHLGIPRSQTSSGGRILYTLGLVWVGVGYILNWWRRASSLPSGPRCSVLRWRRCSPIRPGTAHAACWLQPRACCRALRDVRRARTLETAAAFRVTRAQRRHGRALHALDRRRTVFRHGGCVLVRSAPWHTRWHCAPARIPAAIARYRSSRGTRQPAARARLPCIVRRAGRHGCDRHLFLAVVDAGGNLAGNDATCGHGEGGHDVRRGPARGACGVQ